MSPVTRRSWLSGIFQRGLGDAIAEQPGPLEAAVQRVAAGAGVVHASDAAGLDWVGGNAVDDEALLDHVGCAHERRIDLRLVAGLVEIGLVARTIVVELRRILLERIARGHHGRPRRVIDSDALGCVAGDVERIGDHHRERIADMHGATDGDGRSRRLVHRAAVALLIGCQRGKRAQAVGTVVLASQHRVDAWRFQCFGRVDAADIGMRVRRAHDGGEQLIGELEIVEIAAISREQARVLASPYRLPNCKLAHAPLR